jgi:hypothetical protein
MDEKPRRRWFRFSLRTLFALISICAFAALISPPIVGWLFPPRPNWGGESAMDDPEFREFMRLVERTLHQRQETTGELRIVIGHGQGQVLVNQN